jgi:NAD-dependent SIR2 family protein deacetylase
MTKKKDVEKKEKVRIYYSKDREIFDDELKQYDGKNPLYKEINPLIQRAIFSSENLCFLMGAGASLVTGDDGKLISGSGQSMAGLWDEIKDKEEFKKISDAFRTAANNNLEDLLSRLESEALHFQLNGDTTESEKIGSQIIFVKEFIKEKCKLKLTPQFPHERFIRNIFLRKQSHSRVKIFTLNYDTLLEQAANEVEAVVVDGFNFSHDSTFSPIAFDLDIVHREKTRIHTEDNFYSKLFHIYKLHGSTNWYKSGEKIQRRREDEKDSVMIFPHRDKFKESYEMPFFELVSRFQNCLRKTNTVLFIIGYGFGDEHINRIIKEAVIANLNLQVFVISPTAAMKGKSLDFQKLIEEKGSQNIAFISSNFNDFANNMPSINSEDETKKETPLAIIQGMEPEEISETLEDYDSIL